MQKFKKGTIVKKPESRTKILDFDETKNEYIVCDVNNENDKWEVAVEYAHKNYEEVKDKTLIEKLKEECMVVVNNVNKLHEFKKTMTFYKLPRDMKDLLYKQSRIMDKYIQVLGQRMEILGVTDFKKEETNGNKN